MLSRRRGQKTVGGAAGEAAAAGGAALKLPAEGTEGSGVVLGRSEVAQNNRVVAPEDALGRVPPGEGLESCQSPGRRGNPRLQHYT